MFFLIFSYLPFSSSLINNQTKKTATEAPSLFTDNQLTLPDLNTLIKVPYYQLNDTTGVWTPDFNSKFIASTDSSSTVKFTFKGTRCYVVAHTGPDKCTVKIQIDDFVEESTVVDLYSAINLSNQVVFESKNLMFGEHSIRISYDMPHRSANVIDVAYIYYRPYSTEERLQYKLADKFDNLPSACTKNDNDGSYKTITCQNEGTLNFEFFGTRFWLTGQITGNIRITIDGSLQNIANYDSQQELGVLVYSSNVLDLGNHAIEMSLVNSKIITFFFCQQPYNAVSIPPAEIEPYKYKKDEGYYIETNEFYHKTNGNGNTFSFFFYGTRFWAIGQTIPINDKIQLWKRNTTSAEWNEDIIAAERGLLFTRYLPIDFHNFSIKYEPNASSIDTILTLYNVFYINENNIQSLPSNSILFYDTDYDSKWDIYRSDDNFGSHLYSKAQGATVTIKFVGIKFWLEGSLNPNNGRIEISVDGIQIAIFRLYREKHEKSVVYYESPDLPLGEHTITLRAMDDSPITFSRLFYSFDEDLQSIPPNGIIRVPSHSITRNDVWNTSYDEIWSSSPQAEANYTFYGTKAYLYSAKNDGVGDMEVYIDDTLAAIVNLYEPDENLFTEFISFTSNDLPFGQHTIRVKHPGGVLKDVNCVSVKKVLYRPHLLHSNTVISAVDLNISDNWIKHADSSSSYVETTTNQASLQFHFYGTRFWLTGNGYKERDNAWGEFTITIDETIYGPINSSCPYVSEFSYLLYSSDVLELQDHTVTITVTSESGKKVAICDLIYIQQPKNATIIYPKDMLKTNYAITSRSGLATELYYSVQNLNNYFQFRYLGTSFWLFGVLNSESGLYSILDGDSLVFSKGSAYLPYPFEVCYSLLSISILDYQNHAIQIESSQTGKSLSMHYIFYSSKVDQPFEPYFTIDSKDFSYNNDWKEGDNDNRAFIESIVVGSKVTIKYGGRNFTLEGYLGPCNGMVHIYIDHEYASNVSLYQEEYGFSVFYRSPEDLKPDIHEIDVVNRNGNPIRLSKLYYMPSPTMYFTDSNIFTPSSDFTQTQSFTETTEFTHSVDFSKSDVFADSFEFTKSESFTKTIVFSNSGYFTLSDEFTPATIFSHTQSFSETNSFSESLSFSKSSAFSSSTDFTKSFKFTEQFPTIENQSNAKSNKTTIIVISLVSLVAIGLIIVLFLIFYLRRKNRITENENSFEADSSNLALSTIPATSTHDADELNSYTLDVFGNQMMNYEEDQNDKFLY